MASTGARKEARAAACRPGTRERSRGGGGGLDDEALNTPLGEVAGYFADATGRSFVLHIADELIHHTAEAALLRDLFASRSAA